MIHPPSETYFSCGLCRSIRYVCSVSIMVICKITVLKRTFHEDLAEEYVQMKTGKCDEFEDG